MSVDIPLVSHTKEEVWITFKVHSVPTTYLTNNRKRNIHLIVSHFQVSRFCRVNRLWLEVIYRHQYMCVHK